MSSVQSDSLYKHRWAVKSVRRIAIVAAEINVTRLMVSVYKKLMLIL